MVEEQILARGVIDPSTIKSMLEVPRHRFVPEHQIPYAYKDGPLSIGDGQTISQPYIVALMTQDAELAPEEKVLDIGTGSGYAAAVLSRIVKEVCTIERIEELSLKAQRCFKELGYSNIKAAVGDGSIGWQEEAPFDAIIVTAGAPVVPDSFVAQLKAGGRLIIPIGEEGYQRLVRIRKTGEGETESETLEHVRFVPLIGEEGY